MKQAIFGAAAVALVASAGATAAEAEPPTAMDGGSAARGTMPEPPVTYTWGGYVKLDVLLSSFSDADADVATPAAARDFYVPGDIPVVSGEGDSQTFTDFHAKESRLFFRADANWQGHTVAGYIEMDFIVNPGAGDERSVNAYTPGLRRAFFIYDNWLAGQDWSTFVNTNAFPETVDFIGPTDGMVFVRQPLLRYTLDNLQVAIENPESVVTVTTFGATTTTVTPHVVTGDSVIPDFVGRYNAKTGFGDFAVAGLLRLIEVKPAPSTPAIADDQEIGWGVSGSGKVPVFAGDDIRFALTLGEGIGRYVALNAVDDASIIPGVTLLDPIEVFAGYVAYRHQWNERWRSNLTVSALQASHNLASVGGEVTSAVQSARGNLLFSPMPKVSVGVEFLHALREREDGTSGGLNRLQFMGKYSF